MKGRKLRKHQNAFKHHHYSNPFRAEIATLCMKSHSMTQESGEPSGCSNSNTDSRLTSVSSCEVR